MLKGVKISENIGEIHGNGKFNKNKILKLKQRKKENVEKIPQNQNNT